MTGIYFIPSQTPAYEGISFLLENGSYARIGEDEAYTPLLSDHIILESRLIGLSAKFFRDFDIGMEAPGMMGIITDKTSCETAQFTAPNPFSSMTVDVYTGVPVTQT